MEWNIFEEWIDSTLYLQMKDLIFRSSTKQEKFQLKRENEQYELFTGEPMQRVEEVYHLNYPGELLERIGERREITKRQIRAMALALARTKNLQEGMMFVGNQLSVFTRGMERLLAPDDLALLFFRYLTEEKKQTIYEQILQAPFQNLSEILLALSFLWQDDKLWDILQGKLNAVLGRERTISVYENSRVYIWFIQHFQFRLRGYRKKDMDALKFLMKLPFCSVAATSTGIQEKLQKEGYSREELLFLNYQIVQHVRLPDKIDRHSITGEKLALEVCRTFLDAPVEYPEQTYYLCSELCTDYQVFQIKINGRKGILDALSELVSIKTVAAFRTLYPYINEQSHLKKWKRLVMTDPNWDVIYSLLPEQEYDQCVEETLKAEQDAEKIHIILNRYEALTGKKYVDQFWKSYEWWEKELFFHLIEAGAIAPVELMQQFLQEYRQDASAASEKWKSMGRYMQEYMEPLKTHEAFEMLELLIGEVGLMNEAKPFQAAETLKKSILPQRNSWYSKNTWKCEIIRPFLEVEEHQKLFDWISEYVFRFYTEEYQSFLVQVLLQEENLLWLSKEDARAFYLALAEQKSAKDNAKRLRNLYLTETECRQLQNIEQLQKERREWKLHLEKVNQLKQSFNKRIAKSRNKDGHFALIRDFLLHYPYKMEKEANRIVAAYIRDYFHKEQVILCSAMELAEVFRILPLLYKAGELDLKTIKEYVKKIEVQV